jgi:hypothetical protein
MNDALKIVALGAVATVIGLILYQHVQLSLSRNGSGGQRVRTGSTTTGTTAAAAA